LVVAPLVCRAAGVVLERVALHMPAEAKRLLGKRVTWRAVAKYTQDLAYYDVDEQQKEIAARSGLLR
jgi:hypothetical protein